MTLSVDIEARFGDFQLTTAFQSGGGLTALFGPSGSGKTSVMELVGGVRRPLKGRITLDDRVLVDTTRGIFLAPHRRRIGWVFQEGRLFPHLTGRQNLLYGQWFTPRRERHENFERVVDLLGLAHLLDRRPSGFSGGERSRVGIGRALLTSPRLLLMDEPLAALDDVRKSEILPYIERLRDQMGVEILYVTHSIAEVVRLAGRVVLLSGGKVTASGPTQEVLASLDLAASLGEGEAGAVLDAHVEAHDPVYGLSQLRARAGSIHIGALDLPVGTHVHLRVRARDVLIATERPNSVSALNVFSGRILKLAPNGAASVDLAVDCSGDILLASVTRRSAHELGLEPGRPVYAIVKSVSFDRLGVGTAPNGG
ncbi:MAG: molybdenum ABC transporter ATP-binding protein [Ancalomicrobiaceae bacterium]|nr:molybdenum ABC transporter ATP-binding protein [Ancalomicrobiaceae bacterium]